MPTPEQKRQAAAIFTAASEGKVIEMQSPSWKPCDPYSLGVRIDVFDYPARFRIAPDPIAPGHNKDNITMSKLGEGFRLVSEDEGFDQKHSGNWFKATEIWIGHRWANTNSHNGRDGNWSAGTLRTRLSIESLAARDKPDEYAELRAAHQQGKIIQWNHAGNQWIDLSMGTNDPLMFTRPASAYRIKPAWRLPDPPAGGPPWHRDDFTEADLPEGCRPTLKGESLFGEDEGFYGNRWAKVAPTRIGHDVGTALDCVRYRTRRPLPAIPRTRSWSKPEDVPGACYIRWIKGPRPACWTTVSAVCSSGVLTIGSSSDGAKKIVFTSWDDLFEEHEYSLDRRTWAKCETTEAE